MSIEEILDSIPDETELTDEDLIPDEPTRAERPSSKYPRVNLLQAPEPKKSGFVVACLIGAGFWLALGFVLVHSC